MAACLAMVVALALLWPALGRLDIAGGAGTGLAAVGLVLMVPLNFFVWFHALAVAIGAVGIGVSVLRQRVLPAWVGLLWLAVLPAAAVAHLVSFLAAAITFAIATGLATIRPGLAVPRPNRPGPRPA